MSERDSAAAALRVLLIAEDGTAKRVRAADAEPDVESPLRFDHVPCIDEALTHLQTDGTDAVLLEAAVAPDLTDALSRIRAEGDGTPIIVLFDGRSKSLGPSALAAGARDFLADTDLIGPAVRRSIQHAVERGRLQGEIQKRDDRLQRLIEEMADAVVVVAKDGTVRFVNSAAEELFGRSRHALVGDLFGFPLVGSDTTELEIVTRGGDAVVAEMRVVETEWEGEPAHLATLRDITLRRRAEERERNLIRERAERAAIERSEQRLRMLADASNAFAETLDYGETLNTIVRIATEAMADWCVVDVLEEDGTVRRLALHHHDPGNGPLLEELRQRYAPELGGPHPSARALRSGEPQFIESMDDQRLTELTRDGEHARILREIGIRSALAVPLRAHGRTLGAITFVSAERSYHPAELSFAEELAHRAALALDNARLYRETQEASRAKSEFLAVMSHELRTPLNAIIGYADLLDMGVPQPLSEEQRDKVRRIDASADHLLELIEQILTFSRVEAGQETVERERVRVAELVDECAEMIRPLAERKGLEFGAKAEHPDLEIETDAGKVRQILLNLLGNAVKFTDEGGVHVETCGEGEQVRVVVHDSGTGIPIDAQERVFEPFWQVEQSKTRRSGGTGLGLSVARQLARLLGGELTLESTPGDGSRFHLVLPVRAGRSEP